MARPETVAELLLQVAEDLHDIFDIDDLVVAAFKRHPEKFSLHKYPGQYPDNNKVVATMSGKRGMIGLRLLDKVAPRTFKVSYYGRRILKKLKGELVDDPVITVDQESTLTRALLDDAMYLYESGQKESIHEKQAIRFLQTGINPVAKELLPLLLNKDIEFNSGFQLTKKTMESLIDCVAYLKAKYARHLKDY